ncbi:MAG: hypothetical protein JRH20_00820 [Deltaproteobacteria bacterium]|nr:hypothetical protein [Deltaproteobacteria bacterium]
MRLKTLMFTPLIILSACGFAPETLDDIKSALNSELGGYQLDEELPLFGRSDLDFAPLPLQEAADVPKMGYIASISPQGPEGILGGFWVDYTKGYGVMAGKWADNKGQVSGHLKGIYGRSRTYGDWVFFGKLIDNEGRALGVLSGRQYENVFRGTWVDESNAILGEFTGSTSAEGHFHGRWKAEPRVAETYGVGEMPWHLLH